MGNIRNTLFIILGGLLGIVFLIWLGLKVRPKSFPSIPEQSQPSETIPLPAGLPAPVDRFLKTIYGDEIPVIKTVVISGRGVLKPFMNIPLPARFVFVHNAGKDYRHYFEATLFGIPVLKVNEGYIDRKSYFENPMASFTNDPNSNQAANLTLWAEAIWFPALWVTDPRVHWEPVDENTALLYVPFENDEENFLVRFNLETGLIDTMETMRYRDPGEGQPKILWILRNEPGLQGAESSGRSVGSAMWLDHGSPWAYFDAEEITLNVDVSKYIRQSEYSTEP
jgi:hypothetical protein